MTTSREQQVTDCLIRSRARVERGWCQDAYARDAAGERVSVLPHLGLFAPDAAAYCSAGAVESDRQATPDVVSVAKQRLNEVCDLAELPGFISFNDCRETCKAEVLAMFTAAITGEIEPFREATKGHPWGPNPTEES